MLEAHAMCMSTCGHLVVKSGSDDDSNVEQLVRMEVDVKGSRLPALWNAKGIHSCPRLHTPTLVRKGWCVILTKSTKPVMRLDDGCGLAPASRLHYGRHYLCSQMSTQELPCLPTQIRTRLHKSVTSAPK